MEILSNWQKHTNLGQKLPPILKLSMEILSKKFDLFEWDGRGKRKLLKIKSKLYIDLGRDYENLFTAIVEQEEQYSRQTLLLIHGIYENKINQ